MDRGAWWAAVHGVCKESDTTEQLPGGTCLEQETVSDVTAEVPRGPKNQQCVPPGLQEKEMATYSSILCLENPVDGGAWWAAVHGVAQSWTRLKQQQGSQRK